MNESTLVYLKPEQVARLAQVSKITLARWRVLGTGPRYIKAGRSVRYAQEDVTQWMRARCRTQTAAG